METAGLVQLTEDLYKIMVVAIKKKDNFKHSVLFFAKVGWPFARWN